MSGTPDTTAVMESSQSGPGGFGGILSFTQLNSLQTSNFVARSETILDSNNSPLPPQTYTLDSAATFTYGEVYSWFSPVAFSNGLPLEVFSNMIPFPVSVAFDLDLSEPGLQPPTQAPWFLSAGSKSDTGGVITQNFSVTLSDGPASSPTTVNLAANLTGTSGPEQLGANLLSLPTSVTIPAGQSSVEFSTTITTIGQPYNINMVAYQPEGNLQSEIYTYTVPSS
jgi:hypothetical protein